jgi:hypothetical protein
LAGKTGKRSIRAGCRKYDNIKIDLKIYGHYGLDCLGSG